jgi:hypothetical protein
MQCLGDQRHHHGKQKEDIVLDKVCISNMYNRK